RPRRSVRIASWVAVALVGDVVAHVLAGLHRAVLHDAPERVAGPAVRHDRDLVPVPALAATRLVVRFVHSVATAARRHHQYRYHTGADPCSSHGLALSGGGREVIARGHRVLDVRPAGGDDLGP